YDSKGKPRVFPAHTIPYVIAGTCILFFGWFGFNGGSSMSATDLRNSVVMVNTYLAGGAGATVIALLTYAKHKRSDPLLICNGALGGLVAVTAPCAYIAPWAAVIIGLVAGPIVWVVNWLVEWKLKIDDPVGAFGVHGGCGIFGLIAVGIFSDGTYGGVEGLILGKTGQIISQLIAAGVAIGFSFTIALVIFGAIKYTIGLRVSKEEEVMGLDIGEHGYSAYPEFVITEVRTEEDEEQ
ncbi:MAG: ammonium transporter, partial [archaeon]